MKRAILAIITAAVIGVAIALVSSGNDESPLTGPWQLSDRPTLVIGAGDGTTPDVIGSVAGAIRLDTGTVMIADGQSLRLKLFSADGALIRQTGGRGGGPGEFQMIKAMRRCSADSVFIYDPGQSRVSVFSPTGKFVRATPIRDMGITGPPPYDFFCGRTGVMAFLNRSPAPPGDPGPHRPNVAITIVYPDGTVVPLGTFPASERYFDGSNDFPRPLGRETSLAIGSSRVYIATGDSTAVERLLLNGERTDALVIKDMPPPIRVTEAHRRTFIEGQINRRSGMAGRGSLGRFYEQLEYPALFPAYGGILLDTADNLWVEEYPSPGTNVQTWHVVAQNGTPLGAIAMPAGFQLREVGDDYVLGVWRDELDVQTVRVYRLRKVGIEEQPSVTVQPLRR